MVNGDDGFLRAVLDECAAISTGAHLELTALAVAIHVEGALGVVLPEDRLTSEHLLGSALGRTVEEALAAKGEA